MKNNGETSDMSQEVTNEELEAYWAEVAHICFLCGWRESKALSDFIGDWKEELDSRGHNPDTL